MDCPSPKDGHSNEQQSRKQELSVVGPYQPSTVTAKRAIHFKPPKWAHKYGHPWV